MDPKQIIETLASQLDDQGMAALGDLVKHASTQAVATAAQQQAAKEDGIQKLAADLANAGFEPHEVVQYLDKLAEQQKEAAECQAILGDISVMGQWLGKEAGEVASKVILRRLEEYVQKHAAEDEGSEEDKKEDKAEGLPPQFAAQAGKMKEEGSEEEKEDEDEEGEAEKEASVRAAKLAEILAPVLLRG